VLDQARKRHPHQTAQNAERKGERRDIDLRERNGDREDQENHADREQKLLIEETPFAGISKQVFSRKPGDALADKKDHTRSDVQRADRTKGARERADESDQGSHDGTRDRHCDEPIAAKGLELDVERALERRVLRFHGINRWDS